MSHYDNKIKRALVVYVSIFLFLVTGIVISGYVSYRNFEQGFRHQAENQISAIAELKVNELVNWRWERLGDAQSFYRNSVFSGLVERYFENPTDVKTRNQIISRLTYYQSDGHYDRIGLLDVNGIHRLIIPDTLYEMGVADEQLIIESAASLKSGEIVFLDFQRDTNTDGDIHLSILVPIFAEQSDGRPLGVLVLHINPETYLYPYINRWPIPSDTAETLLVRRDGQDVLFLNEPRFDSDAALVLRYPLTETNLPAVQAVLEKQGIVEGVDYRGESVFADVRHVPDSPWFMVSKMDAAEIYAPLRARLWQTLLIISMAIFVAGMGLVTVWRQQRLLFYRAQVEATEALRASEEKFRKAFIISPDSININRLQDGMYISINNGFTKIMGYLPEEVIGKSSLELNIWADPQDRQALVDGLKKTGEIANLEARFRAKNGDVKHGLMSASVLELNGVPHIISITRDITERKQAETELAHRETLYRNLFETMIQGVVYQDRDGRITSANNAAQQILGLTLDEMQGRSSIDPRWNSIHEDGSDFPGQTHPAMLALQTGKPVRNVIMGIFNPRIEATTWILIHATPEFLPGEEKPYRVYATFEDITERKQAEEALRESEQMLHTVLENFPGVVFWKDTQSNYLGCNHSFAVGAGLNNPIEIIGKTDFDLPWKTTEAANYQADDCEVMESGKAKLHILETQHQIDNRVTWFDTSKMPLRDSNGQVIGVLGVSTDITERIQAEEARIISEANLQALINNRNESIWSLDNNYNLIVYNDYFRNIYHATYNVELKIGLNLVDILPPELRAFWKLKYDAVLSGEKISFEFKETIQDNLFYFDVFLNPIFSEGKIAGASVLSVDITARKRAEDALRESEAVYRQAIEVANAVPYRQSYHVNGKTVEYEFMGEGIRQITGYGPEEFDEELWDSLTQERFLLEDLAQYSFNEAIERVRSGVSPVWKCEHRIRARDGSIHWIFEAAVELRNANGISHGSIGLFQDITERKQAEVLLMESENLYRKMNENSPLGMHFYKLNNDDQLIFAGANPAADKLLGVDNSQFIGKTIEEAFPPLAQTEVPARYRGVAAEGIPWSTEQIAYEDDRIMGAFEVRAFQTTPGNMVAVFADVTERKQAEEKINQLNLELEQRVIERTVQLETANKELEAFSYSVSHDLRAPLRGIDGWSQALLEDYHDQLDEQGRQYIDRVRSETQRMGHLIDDMLQLSRLTRIEMVTGQVDLSALAQTIVERLKRDEPHRKVDFDIQTGITAEGDSHLLEAALANLLENAFKFTAKRADARIEFGETELEGRRVFFLRDNGAGFDMTYAQKLFGAFQRMHKASEFPGTGVGLATVQRIIHRHGGRVWAESKVDLGATFYFTLG